MSSDRSEASTEDFADRTAFLRKHRPWTSLSEEALRLIAAEMHEAVDEGGVVLLRNGAPSSSLYVVTAGAVEVRARTRAGTVAKVARLYEGDCFGEMSLLTGDPASADIVTVGRAETLSIDGDRLLSLMREFPEITRELVIVISRRLAAAVSAMGLAQEEEQQLALFLGAGAADKYGELVGKDKEIRAIVKRLAKISAGTGPVLVRGERGTGKEIIARRIHEESDRREAPFLSVRCGQIVETPWGDKLCGPSYQSCGPMDENAPRAYCYLELAHCGSILLKDIDALPSAVQVRLVRFLRQQQAGQPVFDVRIFATCSEDLETLAQSGSVSSALCEAFSDQIIDLPPLRDRKRDIPLLAEAFLPRIAARTKKRLEGFHSDAIAQLVSHDYRVANVTELREAVERAAILADDEVISPDWIFLGAPREEVNSGVDLLPHPDSSWRATITSLLDLVKLVVAICFLVLLAALFLDPHSELTALVLTSVWSIGWPALALSCFLLGRFWCAICPLAFMGSLTQSRIGREMRVPKWMKDWGVYLALAGFLLIIWAEDVSDMRHSGIATGILLVCIATGAIVAGALFQRRAWCRHLCPLGTFLGVCATSSALELRPTTDLCLAQCGEHNCFKGSEKADGCPMFAHLMFVDSNQDCVLCMRCIDNCPNDSPQFLLRWPGSELGVDKQVPPGLALFAAILLGEVFVLVGLQRIAAGPAGDLTALLEQRRLLVVTVALMVGAVVPLLLYWLMSRRHSTEEDPQPANRFRQNLLALSPLAAAGFASFQIAHIPGLDKLHSMFYFGAASGEATPLFNLSLLRLLRFGLVCFGLSITMLALWKLHVGRCEAEPSFWDWAQENAGLLFLAIAYVVLLTVMGNCSGAG